MIKHLTYFLAALVITLAFFSCKGKKSATATSSAVLTGEAFQQAFFTAETEKIKGNTTNAYKSFQECLSLAPDAGAVNFEMAKLEKDKLNNLPMALTHAQKAVASDKSNPWYHLLLAEIHRDMGKYELAIKEYQEVKKLKPGSAETLYELANLYLYQEKYAEAIKVYDELEQVNGPYEELSFQKHQLYLQIKQPDKAGLELEKLAEAYPEEARYWGVVAQFYQQVGNKEKAQIALEKMVKADPENGQVHYQLSEFYAAAGDDQKSYQELKKAFATTDVTIDQKINILLKYFNLTQYNPNFIGQAYELLALTEKTHPKEAKAASIYGDFLYRDKRDQEALTKYQTALALDGTKSLIWSQIMVIESGLKNFNELESDSRKAMELFPNMPEFYYYNGVANDRLKQFDKAIESFSFGKEIVVENDNLLIQFYSAMGGVYNEMKEYAKSDESYDFALGLNPDNAYVLNNYSYYLSLRKVKLDAAAKMAKHCNELDPDNSSFEDTYAWVLFTQGRYDDAKLWAEKAISHTSTNGELLEHYGDILYKLGKTVEALDRWKAARTAGGGSKNLEQKILQQRFID